MTNNEKKQILEMREVGLSYSEIARKLSLSPTAVRSYCHRHKTVVRKETVTVKCQFCGKEMEQNEKGKAKRFCSQSCYHKWWYKKNNTGRTREVKCKYCGAKFLARGSAQKYCCHSCYILDRFEGQGDKIG